MTEQLQMQAARQTLTLAGMPLAVNDYALRMECPVRKHTLCSGAPLWSAIGRLPCTLAVEGQIAAADADSLLVTLKDALNRHAAIRFTFFGTDFTGMQLTEMCYQSNENPKLTDYKLCFVGEMQTGGPL